MELSDLIAANRDLIYFVYGQVFFVMGLAVALQTRRRSRLELARSLQWLALFGLIHGAYEWGEVFIPIQSRFLPESTIHFLMAGRNALLGLSFACLLAFGLSLLHGFVSAAVLTRLRAVPAVLFVVWFAIALYGVLPVAPTFDEWSRTANALARYFIGLPGALLAAYGLRRHALERIAPLGLPEIVRALRVAGYSLALYAVLAGVIVPQVGFFPGNLINGLAFQNTVGLPVTVFRSLCGGVLAFTIIRALEVFDVEVVRQVERMEQAQILAAERERIGRDLHDGAIQLVYTAGLLVESAQAQAPDPSPLRDRLDRAVAVLRDAVTALRRNLGELRATPAGVPLREALASLARDRRWASFIELTLESNLTAEDSMDSERADHLVTIVNEALSNVVRHAQARRVLLLAQRNAEGLRVMVQDDGTGMPARVNAGYGLRNMRERARLLRGELRIEPGGRRGTRVIVDVPWEDVP